LFFSLPASFFLPALSYAYYCCTSRNALK
jgi:hypothetical protein